MKICYSIVFVIIPLVPIPLLAQTSGQQPTERLPSQSINYQICTLTVNPETGGATSVCSSVYKCTNTGKTREKLGVSSNHRELEEMDNYKSNLTTAHAIRVAM